MRSFVRTLNGTTLPLLAKITMAGAVPLFMSCQSTNHVKHSASLPSGIRSETSTESAAAGHVPFEEFQKILSPRGRFLPLPGGEESLVLMVMPGDAYAKIYSLQHSTGKFTLKHDIGRPIHHIGRDYTLKNYYILADNNGDENFYIGKYDPQANKSQPFFGRPGFRATIADFSSDGETLYVLSNHENKSVFSLYAVDRETGLAKRLTDGKQSFDAASASADGRWLALNQMLGNNESHLWLMDLKNAKIQKILSRSATNYNTAFFSPDGKTLFVNSNQGRDRMACGKIALTPLTTPLTTSQTRRLEWAFTKADRDIECDQQRPGDITFLIESFDGQILTRAFRGVFETELELPPLERALVSNFVLLPGEMTAYLRIIRADNPGDYFRFDISKGKSAPLERLTKMNVSRIPDAALAKSFDLRYKSFDGLEIHGLIFAREEWTQMNQKRPVILWPHGGPDSSEMHAYRPFFQFWVQNGFVVFAPNFRGSAGYGKKFETLNNKDWGGGHIKDLIAGKKAVEKLPYVDPNRIFIVGASFGGYSTLSAVTQYPMEFRGAVAIAALANLFTFMTSIPPDPAWQNEFKTELGDPKKDAKLFRDRSPYFFAEKIRVPLKIYQAENDVRTVKAEMDEFVARMEQHKIPVEYVVLQDEGHGFSRTETWKTVLEGTVEFLNRIR